MCECGGQRVTPQWERSAQMCGDEWLLLWLYRRGRSGRPEKMCGDDGLLSNVCILVGYVLYIWRAQVSVALHVCSGVQFVQ